jgi:flagellar biosynthesis/type III secretory pathway M-ring protein FliF/YscJ
LEYGLALILLVAVVAVVVIRPLLRRPEEHAPDEARRAELEAAKEAKYREIHDAQLDHEMGKLSDADYRTVDRELRQEAIEILQQLDRLP